MFSNLRVVQFFQLVVEILKGTRCETYAFARWPSPLPIRSTISTITVVVIAICHCAVDQPVHNWLFYTTHGYPEHPPLRAPTEHPPGPLPSELSGTMAVGSVGSADYEAPREVARGRFPVGVPIASGGPTRSPLSFGGVAGELAVAMPFGTNPYC